MHVPTVAKTSEKNLDEHVQLHADVQWFECQKYSRRILWSFLCHLSSALINSSFFVGIFIWGKNAAEAFSTSSMFIPRQRVSAKGCSVYSIYTGTRPMERDSLVLSITFVVEEKQRYQCPLLGTGAERPDQFHSLKLSQKKNLQAQTINLFHTNVWEKNRHGLLTRGMWMRKLNVFSSCNERPTWRAKKVCNISISRWHFDNCLIGTLSRYIGTSFFDSKKGMSLFAFERY